MRLKLAIMRRAAGLCLLLVMSACAEEALSLPTAPTVPAVVAPPPHSTRTVTASVWLHSPTERQPLTANDHDTDLPDGIRELSPLLVGAFEWRAAQHRYRHS